MQPSRIYCRKVSSQHDAATIMPHTREATVCSWWYDEQKSKFSHQSHQTKEPSFFLSDFLLATLPACNWQSTWPTFCRLHRLSSLRLCNLDLLQTWQRSPGGLLHAHSLSFLRTAYSQQIYSCAIFFPLLSDWRNWTLSKWFYIQLGIFPDLCFFVCNWGNFLFWPVPQKY